MLLDRSISNFIELSLLHAFGDLRLTSVKLLRHTWPYFIRFAVAPFVLTRFTHVYTVPSSLFTFYLLFVNSLGFTCFRTARFRECHENTTRIYECFAFLFCWIVQRSQIQCVCFFPKSTHTSSDYSYFNQLRFLIALQANATFALVHFVANQPSRDLSSRDFLLRGLPPRERRQAKKYEIVLS